MTTCEDRSPQPADEVLALIRRERAHLQAKFGDDGTREPSHYYLIAQRVLDKANWAYYEDNIPKVLDELRTFCGVLLPIAERFTDELSLDAVTDSDEDAHFHSLAELLVGLSLTSIQPYSDHDEQVDVMYDWFFTGVEALYRFGCPKRPDWD